MKGLAAPLRASAAVEVVNDSRVIFIDLLRLLAAFQMVHGHTLDAILADELRRGAAFDRWSWGRGLVSVGFLVGAGLSYHLSTLARFDEHRGSRAAVRRRFRRAAWLVALGYLLHLPFGASSGEQALRELATVDVLHCIGVCLLALELLTLRARRAVHVVALAGALAVTAIALAPLADRIVPAGAAMPLLGYLTARAGSLFPLLPWAGYLFAGVVVGQLVLPQGPRTPRSVTVGRLAACAIAILGLSGLAELAPLTLTDAGTSYASRPAFVLLKLGVVLAVAAGLALVGQRVARLPRVAEILAGETLVVYVVHLLIVYGAGLGLRAQLGRTLPLPSAILVGAAMVVSMALVGLGWHRLEAARARVWRATT